MRAFIAANLFLFCVYLAAAIGWIANIFKVIHGAQLTPHMADMSVLLLVRIVGIFVPPLGAFMGLFVP